jgi:hypothetical protein
MKQALIVLIIAVVTGAASLIVAGHIPGDVCVTHALQSGLGANPEWTLFLTLTANAPLLWGSARHCKPHRRHYQRLAWSFRHTDGVWLGLDLRQGLARRNFRPEARSQPCCCRKRKRFEWLAVDVRSGLPLGVLEEHPPWQRATLRRSSSCSLAHLRV